MGRARGRFTPPRTFFRAGMRLPLWVPPLPHPPNYLFVTYIHANQLYLTVKQHISYYGRPLKCAAGVVMKEGRIIACLDLRVSWTLLVLEVKDVLGCDEGVCCLFVVLVTFYSRAPSGVGEGDLGDWAFTHCKNFVSWLGLEGCSVVYSEEILLYKSLGCLKRRQGRGDVGKNRLDYLHRLSLELVVTPTRGVKGLYPKTCIITSVFLPNPCSWARLPDG